MNITNKWMPHGGTHIWLTVALLCLAPEAALARAGVGQPGSMAGRR